MSTQGKLSGRGLWRRLKAVRLPLVAFLVLAALSGLTSSSQAAGIYTHTLFVQKSIEYLKAQGGYGELVALLQRHGGTVNYGSMFPDTTVPPWIDEGWGEDVHDTVDVRKNYGEYLAFLDRNGYSRKDNKLQTGYYYQFLSNPASPAT